MDTLMHGLAGLVLASCQPRKVVPERRAIYWAVVLAAEVPDLDLVLMPTGPLGHLYYHRGLFHSLFMAPLLAVAVAWLISRLFKGTRMGAIVLWALLGVVVGHLFLDWMTSFGTRLLLPFSNAWLSSDWTAEVELGLLLPPIFALLLSYRRLQWRVPLLRLAGALMLAFVAYRAVAHGLLQRELARTYGVPAAAVTVEPVLYRLNAWEYVVRGEHDYRLGWVYLDGQHVERATLHRELPADDPILAAAVRTAPGREIWHFVRNPVLSRVHVAGGYKVLISDLRGGYALNFQLSLDERGDLRGVRRDYGHEYLVGATARRK